jgi:hypothetical protein
MSFLRKAAREEDSYDSDKAREEQYLYLFPKIGRDFVTREDLSSILGLILVLLGRPDLQVDLESNTYAKQMAENYKDKINKGTGPDYSKLDLVNMDD